MALSLFRGVGGWGQGRRREQLKGGEKRRRCQPGAGDAQETTRWSAWLASRPPATTSVSTEFYIQASPVKTRTTSQTRQVRHRTHRDSLPVCRGHGAGLELSPAGRAPPHRPGGWWQAPSQAPPRGKGSDEPRAPQRVHISQTERHTGDTSPRRPHGTCSSQSGPRPTLVRSFIRYISVS